MNSSAPIYRHTCLACERPALTLDHSGDPYCAIHAEVFIAAEHTTVVLTETEMSVLLVHRSLVTDIR